MKDNKVLQGKISSVFFSFAIPAVLGLVASSSACIIDGVFVGKHIGEKALAAITLCVPIFPFLVGIAILFSTGGEVFVGKYIGEGKPKKASDIFTKVLMVVFAISILIVVFGLLFLHKIIEILGADQELYQMVKEYLTIIIISAPLFSMYSLSYFVRVDGKPYLSAGSLIITAVVNIILDYIFIIELDWGVKGAAWGTSLSYGTMPLLLLPHFLGNKGVLRFVAPSKSWKILKDIAFNGASEFFSELSGGILLFVINITLMKYYGNEGVAAYAVVSYLLYFITMASYGISDSIKSIVSINFGAGQRKRIQQFLRLAMITVISLGAALVLTSQLKADQFVGLFLKDTNEGSVGSLASDFILSIAPAVLILGVNIIWSAYFTAIHRPKQSLIISLLGTLVLPIILIYIITYFIGGNGIIMALNISEVTTLVIAICLALASRNKLFYTKT